MPHREWRLRIEDILSAVDRIESFIAGMTEVQFLQDQRTIDAVARNLGIIGEAARHVPDEIRGRAPEVPWRTVVAMRNFVIHEYMEVDDSIIWQTATADIGGLREAMNRLLEAE
jgi:uncharacterized protein with HEPN domain